MQTITLNMSDNIVQNVLSYLSSFSDNEIEIITKTPYFDQVKKELNEEFLTLNNPSTQFYTLEELNAKLEETIEKYENKDYK